MHSHTNDSIFYFNLRSIYEQLSIHEQPDIDGHILVMKGTCMYICRQASSYGSWAFCVFFVHFSVTIVNI